MSHFQRNFITTVIDRYGLELDGHQVDTIIVDWFQKYDNAWIVKAIIESLYRGRYKIVSVDNILKDWQRLGKPRSNFTPEYEREILQNLPDITDLAANLLPPAAASLAIGTPSQQDNRSDDPEFPVVQAAVLSSKNLNPEESAPFQQHHHSIPTFQTKNIQTGLVPTSAVKKVRDAYPTDNSEQENDHLSISLASSLAILQARDHAKDDRHRSAKVNRTISQPAKFQLFNRLKAIVEPNHQSKKEVYNSSVYLPLYVEHHHSPHTVAFQLPLENASGE